MDGAWRTWLKVVSTGVLAGVMLFPPAGATTTVYRCETPDGPAYSQYPCNRSSAPLQLEPARTVRIPPISAAERQRLNDIERTAELARQRRASARQQETRAARREQALQRERCHTARAGRKALARQRRKGYTLKQARALERRDAELAGAERANC